jgi:hypothetical protein
LQSFVGCGLATGIVPVQATFTVCPALLGTVTLCVDGVAAPPCKAPKPTATTAAATTASTAAALRRLEILGMHPPGRGKGRADLPGNTNC